MNVLMILLITIYTPFVIIVNRDIGCSAGCSGFANEQRAGFAQLKVVRIPQGREVGMEVGEELAYRLRSDAPSERVRVLEIERRKQSTRAVVEFMDNARSGHVENVPAGRLRVPWSEVAAFDALMVNCGGDPDGGMTNAKHREVGDTFLHPWRH